MAINKRIRLCIISIEGVNQRQSIPRMTDEYVSRLDPRRYEISVVAREISNQSKISGLDIKHVRFPALYKNLLLRQINNLYVMLKMREVHRRNKFDISHGMDFIHDPYADIVTVQSTILGGIKTINRSEKNRLYAKILRYFVPSNWISYLIERRTAKKCKKLIAISEKIRSELIDYYAVPPSKIALIYPATSLEKFKPLSAKDKTRNRLLLGFRKEQFIVVFVGYHFLRKGGDLLLDATKILRDKYPKLHSIFIGSEDRNEKNCTFLQNVSDVEKYYGIADAFVFPTKYEPFGYVTLEAMACGLPVIVSPPQFNGAAEIITDGKDGILLKEMTPEHLAKQMEKLIKKPQLCQDIGSKARKTALNFDWKTFTQKSSATYRVSGRQ